MSIGKNFSRRDALRVGLSAIGSSVASQLWAVPVQSLEAQNRGDFEGKHYCGRGDFEYLQLLDTARRMFEPDPEFQNLSMLYTPQWNGFVEGPTWSAWWIQNSYGTTYCALPFYQEPFLRFLQNSQDLWLNQMGDGKRHGCPRNPRFNWVAPDGQLCDCASPGCIIYKQGDGRVEIHDWGLEFTAAGILMQSELLLISRDRQAIAHYLPLLERSANFLDTRRDPKNNLFLAGPAANLLAPSYAGWARPDGTYGKAYLAGLSITYMAALDRLIELEKLAGSVGKFKLYSSRRELARQGLPLITTEEGYFIKSLDPDGTRHGVYGARQHGYFESSPNHDAIAFRIVDRVRGESIYAKIASIPELRPYAFIICNYPSLDDMYERPRGLWRFGEWVNGGAWSTCEARMILAYYRLDKYEDARRSLIKLLGFARRFRMDNPFTDFGDSIYQPNQPINITYDAFGPPAAFIRGLFEYLYSSEGVRLVPHIPPRITELRQLDPVRFGSKQLYLSTVGSGPVTSATVNGRPWRAFDNESVLLAYQDTPDVAEIVIGLGGEARRTVHGLVGAASAAPRGPCPGGNPISPTLPASLTRATGKLRTLLARLEAAGFTESYEAAHIRLILAAALVAYERDVLLARGKLPILPKASQTAAHRSYLDSVMRLSNGLVTLMKSYGESSDERSQKIYEIYAKVK